MGNGLTKFYLLEELNHQSESHDGVVSYEHVVGLQVRGDYLLGDLGEITTHVITRD